MNVSESEQKLFNFISEFIKSQRFQDKIKEIRKNLEIPKNGYLLPKNHEVFLVDFLLITVHKYLPEFKVDKIKPLNLAIKGLVSEIPIADSSINNFFTLYTLFNKEFYELFYGGLDITGLCKVEDIYDFIAEYQFIAPPEEAIEIIKKHFEAYPIVIKLNPSISQNALISFIKKHWTKIQFHLSQYKNGQTKLGKLKKKNSKIAERDEFIYQNRDKNGKEIRGLVQEKFGVNLPYEYIPKIISREKNKRQKA